MKKNKFLGLIAVPFIVILAFILIKSFTLTTGTDILLETAPIDPVDLFRGNYVALSYVISTVNLETTPHDKEFIEKETIYALLSQKDEFWTIDKVSHKKPQVQQNQVCMKGKVTSSWRENQVRVEWGIESFFLPTDQAKKVEREREDAKAGITVDSRCASVLKALEI